MAKINAARRRLSFSVIFISALALIGLVYLNPPHACSAIINYDINETTGGKHNYIVFVNNEGNELGRLTETNGWLLLEAVLDKELYNTTTLDATLAEFTSGTTIYGWWPKESIEHGKQYFKNKPPVTLYPDSDDTAWAYRYYDRQMPDTVVQSFISSEPLPEMFAKACAQTKCNPEKVIRVWADEAWHDDVDIISIANFITILNTRSPLQAEIFETNKALLNHIIEHENYAYYFKYYEPKETGYVLVLFYDQQKPIVSARARDILRKQITSSPPVFNQTSLASRWGGGDDWFYGCNIITINERIPTLLWEYARSRGILIE